MSSSPSPLRPSAILRLTGFVVLLAVVCGAVSWAVSTWVSQGGTWRHDEPHGHAWLHRELDLTAEEAARIDTFEQAYRLRRRELEAEFEVRKTRLARLLRDNMTSTPEVSHAIHGLHEIHGALQQLSVDHYYEMLSVLPAEKQARLRELAVEALSTPR